MSKDEPSDGSTSNEDVQLTNDEAESEITIPITESKSYAKVKGKYPTNQTKKKWPPGTKPSQINFKPCNNPAHKPGEDRDHMGWECPHKHIKHEPKPLEIDYEQLAKHLAPLLNQNKVCYLGSRALGLGPRARRAECVMRKSQRTVVKKYLKNYRQFFLFLSSCGSRKITHLDPNIRPILPPRSLHFSILVVKKEIKSQII